MHQPIHTSFDNQGAIVYPIQPYVLDAVEAYLNWLDLQDGGKPWVNQQVPVDYLKCLRSEHPLLVRCLLSLNLLYSEIPCSQMVTCMQYASHS